MVNAFVEAGLVSQGQLRTSRAHLCSNPVWNELMDFLVVDEKRDRLLIAVRDRDLLNKVPPTWNTFCCIFCYYYYCFCC